MIPKLKKKIKSFLMDESGNITKKNITKAALFLITLNTITKKTKAQTVDVRTGNPVDILNCGSPHPSHGRDYGIAYGGQKIPPRSQHTLIGNDGNCVAEWRCLKDLCSGYDTVRCLPTGQSQSGKGRHTSNGQMIHWNADVAEHANTLSLIKDNSINGLRGRHEHHGSHANADEIEGGAPCGTPEHTNHCSHGSHTSW
ncbi:MAG: hypothetical protein ACMXYG_07810 [Candidatus Woesearchaeota archaeon]